MISSVSSNGFRVEKIYPSPYEINVNVTDEIKVTFNMDINTSTIINSFVVLKDKYMTYKNEDSLKRIQDFEVVEGSISYKNKTIFFKSTSPLDKSSRYIVCIKKNSITDILGNKMIVSFYSSFVTSINNAIPSCSFISPPPNTIYKNTPVFEWADMNVQSYIFQISKQPTFETIYCDEFILPVHVEDTSAISRYEPKLELSEGLYYARVKALCGEWSEILQFFIKPTVVDDVQTHIDELANNEEYEDNLLIDLLNQVNEDNMVEVLDIYPKDGSVDIDTKLNCVYIKVRGLVSEKDIDFDLSYLEGFMYDADNGDMDTDVGIVDGTWNFVYDKAEDATYIIFVLGSNAVTEVI